MADDPTAILLVDDEESVISSLRRLLRRDGYSVLGAHSAEEGVRLLSERQISLVISDNAMPGTSGVQFLNLVRERWPDVVRIMLTGHADLASVMDAINEGAVYRFITKPWEPAALRLVVRDAVAHYHLVADNRAMHALIEEQNAQLTQWNESLQQLVLERTKEVTLKNAELERLFDELKGSFVDMIKVFTGLVELRNQAIAGHDRRVASLSSAIAREMALSEDQVKGVEVAALLHDIGKIGLADEILRKDERLLLGGERISLRQHPILGQAVLGSAESLEPIGLMVRHHHERWDGKGYPDALRGEAIPMASRIIAVADAVDHCPAPKKSSRAAFAKALLSDGTSPAYDPRVLLALDSVMRRSPVDSAPREVAVGVRDLKAGMVLARDLRTVTGILLVPKAEHLRTSYLGKLAHYATQNLVPSTVYVYSGRQESEGDV